MTLFSWSTKHHTTTKRHTFPVAPATRTPDLACYAWEGLYLDAATGPTQATTAPPSLAPRPARLPLSIHNNNDRPCAGACTSCIQH
ncbi:hypothetical protein [Paenarthrobacter sp. NPDC058040]|uniref:hypothetical protein n=1 Tax=unclassified Paenarthrobacter TaxID=2634190 RepID=UPI0036D87DB6